MAEGQIDLGPRGYVTERDDQWWVICYGDKSTFSDEDGHPQEAPAWDVQGIIVPHTSAGSHVLYAGDYYIWKPNWYGVDRIGLLDWLLNEADIVDKAIPGPTTLYQVGVDLYDWNGLVLFLADIGVVKLGRAKTQSGWQDILQWMTELNISKNARVQGEPFLIERRRVRPE